jgi:hypothetical protein
MAFDILDLLADSGAYGASAILKLVSARHSAIF